MLDLMGECSVARNVAAFVRELVDVLIHAKSGQSGQVHLNLADLDPSLPLALSDGAFGFDFNAFKTFDFSDDPFQPL
jgi:hypothetical protein